MSRYVRFWLAGTAVGMMALGFLAVVNRGVAADEENKERAAVLKLADMIANGKTDAARKEAATIAKGLDLEDVMHNFKLRKDKGIGFGEKGPSNTADGIEAKLINLGKKPLSANDMKAQADAIAEMANRTAAIAQIASNNPSSKVKGAKALQDWKKWTQEMEKASLDLGKAAKAKDSKGVKDAAMRANASCSDCHALYKD
jgi:cytochrome c556